MNFKIEKGVPISPYYWERYQKYVVRKKSKRKSKFPFKDMEIGDSFGLPQATSNHQATQIRLIANAYGFKLGRRFVVLQDDHHRYRCWRLS